MASPSVLPLHEWSGLRNELLWIYDQAVAPSSREQSNNRRAEHHAWLLRKGRCRFEHDSGTFLIRPGMWFFVPSGRARQTFSEDSELLSIRFLQQWPSGESFLHNNKGLLFKGSDHPLLEKRARSLASLVRLHFPALETYKGQSSQETDGRFFFRLQAYFHSWLETWLDVNIQHGMPWTRLRSGDGRLLQAARCLNDAPLDTGFPRSRMLEQTRLSEVHLNRLFVNEFGLSPRKYWDKRRLGFAKNSLENSFTPVKEIAWRLGFRSDSHFAVWFKKQSGVRPGQHRAGPSDKKGRGTPASGTTPRSGYPSRP